MAQVKKTLKKKVGDILFYISATIFVGAVFFVVLFIFGLILNIVDAIASTF